MGALCVGGVSSVARRASWLLLGNMVYYSALTGEQILFGAHFYCAFFNLINTVFWGRRTHNRYRRYFCSFVTDKMLPEPTKMGTYSLMP